MSCKPIESIQGQPVIGRYYLVNCIEYQFDNVAPRIVPLLGPVHEDKEIIGVEGMHWHIDFRFIDKDVWEEWNANVVRQSKLMSRVVWMRAAKGEKPRVRRRRCRRQMPIFPTQYIGHFGETKDSAFAAPLEAAYANQKLKPDCRVCPHRGVPLTGLPVSTEGNVTCPGHGLRWNLRTRELVRRVPVAGGVS